PRRGRDARADAADGDAHREPGRRPSRLRGARAAEPANESHLAPAVDDRAAARGRPPLRVRAGHAQPALVRRGQRSGAKHAAMSSTDLAHAARDAARWHSAWRDDEAWLGRVLLAPAVLYIVALVGFPFLLAIVYSMSDVTVGTTALDFVGLRNFRRVLDDPTFWSSLRNALVFTLVSQLLVVVLGKILAMALYGDFRGKWLVRLLILLPWVAPISLGTIGWLWIFDPVYSILNWSARAI